MIKTNITNRKLFNFLNNLFTELESNNKKSVQFAEEVEVKTVKREPEVVEIEIDEQKMDRLLHLLHEADPQSDSSDPQEMLDLEGNPFFYFYKIYR
jgi:signal transducing adaptor molecule